MTTYRRGHEVTGKDGQKHFRHGHEMKTNGSQKDTGGGIDAIVSDDDFVAEAQSQPSQPKSNAKPLTRYEIMEKMVQESIDTGVELSDEEMLAEYACRVQEQKDRFKPKPTLEIIDDRYISVRYGDKEIYTDIRGNKIKSVESDLWVSDKSDYPKQVTKEFFFKYNENEPLPYGKRYTQQECFLLPLSNGTYSLKPTEYFLSAEQIDEKTYKTVDRWEATTIYELAPKELLQQVEEIRDYENYKYRTRLERYWNRYKDKISIRPYWADR